MSENTIIELKPTQAAFVLDENWDMEIHMPDMDDEDNVPMHVMFIAALGAVTQDEDIVNDILNKFFEMAVLSDEDGPDV
jgi:hypothetical protein